MRLDVATGGIYGKAAARDAGFPFRAAGTAAEPEGFAGNCGPYYRRTVARLLGASDFYRDPIVVSPLGRGNRGAGLRTTG